MHGHGFPPPQPPRPTAGSLIALRVLFSAVTVLSCGLLGWIPMLRLAIVTRRALHWILVCALIVFHVACLIYVGESTPEDPDAELSDATALVLIAWFAIGTAGVLTYYLITDIRHYDRIAATPPPALPMPGSPYQATGVSSYGFPPVPVHRHPAPAPQPQFPTKTPPPSAPAPPPAPAPRPVPASEPPRSGRIEQVRAELDELSDLLRKEEDR